MNITIHRGANQIGGSITEISTEGCKILIDFGSNLPGSKKSELTQEQIEKITSDADAVFYTHFHGDHVGLHHLIPADIPQYMGEGAKEVMVCKYEALNEHADFLKQLEAARNMQTYQASQRIDVDNKEKIYITPYFVSHSAFDAYMFLIECEGKKILHTGDFRSHGYLGKGFFPTLQDHIDEVDILITEGTMLGRKHENVLPEIGIQRNIALTLKKHKYVFALCSSTDLDRMASMHAACKNTGRVFLVDKFQKRILDIFRKYAGAKSSFFNFDKAFKLINLTTPNVKNKLQKNGFLMPIRLSHKDRLRKIFSTYNDEEPWLIYSMWSGYAEEGKDYTIEDAVHIKKLFGERVVFGTKDGVHTSGHATMETLKEVCLTVNPRIGIIPIHKDENSQYDCIGDLSEYRVFDTGNTTIEGININVQS